MTEEKNPQAGNLGANANTPGGGINAVSDYSAPHGHAAPAGLVRIDYAELLLGVLGFTDDEFASLGYEGADGEFHTAVYAPADAIDAAPRLPANLDCYFGALPTAGPARINAGRGKAADATRLTALWADIDVKAGACPTLDIAWAIIANVSIILGARPSAIVKSGGGLHPYWAVEDGDDIDAARPIPKRFGRLVAAVADKLGVDIKVDNVYDMARMMRLPDSNNMKTGQPRPVTAWADTGGPLTISEIVERLDEYGIPERDDDTASREEISPPADWVWAETTCPYVAKMIAGFAADTPPTPARNPWLVSQYVRLASAHRYGCITEVDYKQALANLETRFAQIVEDPRIGDPRQVKKYEHSDARKWGIGKAATKTVDEVRAELGGHTHPDTAPGDTAGQNTAPFDDTEFWEARASLRCIHDYALACMVSPWGLLGVLIIYMLDQVPYSVALPGIADDESPGALNLFAALVDGSGAGKGRLEKSGERYLRRGHVSLPPGSGEGLPKMFARRPTPAELKAEPGDPEWVEIVEFGGERIVFKRHNIVVSVPEVDTLTALAGRNGATLFETLRRGFSGETLGFAYADESKRLIIPAHKYRLGLIVGVQPERSGILLDDAATTGGTPQRFLWVPASDKRIRAKGRPAKPEPVKPYRGPWPATVPVCDTASDTIMAGVEARAQGHGEALDGHLLFVRLKAAAALAVLDGRCDVTDEDWELAATVIEMSNRQRQLCVDALTAVAARENERRGRSEGVRAVISAQVQQNAEADQLDRVAELLTKKVTESGPVKPGALKQSLNSRYRHLFDTALAEAVGQGRLVVLEGEVAAPC